MISNPYRKRLQLFLALLLFSSVGSPLAGQQSAADSAQVLLNAARILERQGRSDLAQEVIRQLRARWPNSIAAAEAGRNGLSSNAEPLAGFDRTSFIGYHTLLGAWIGIAIPAALDAKGPEPYGAGLLIGAPLGFLGSRMYASKHALTEGQASTISFASQFAMWQAVGWAEALDIGSTLECFGDYCYQEAPERRPFTSSLIGAAAGLTAGALLSRKPIAAGTASMVSAGGYWGAWWGFAADVLAGQENDYGHHRLQAALIGSAATAAVAIPLAKRWRPSSGRVHLITAGGLAGGLAGVGLALLTDTDSEKSVVGLMLGGNIAGMLVTGMMTKNRPGEVSGDSPSPALFSVRNGLQIGIPTPIPVRIPLKRSVHGKDYVMGLRIPLFAMEY